MTLFSLPFTTGALHNFLFTLHGTNGKQKDKKKNSQRQRRKRKKKERRERDREEKIAHDPAQQNSNVTKLERATHTHIFLLQLLLKTPKTKLFLLH